MASDGRVTADNRIITNKCRKVFELSGGGLLGLCGDSDSDPIVQALDRVRTPAQIPEGSVFSKFQIEFDAILALPGYLGCWMISAQPREAGAGWKGEVFEVKEPYFAIGSGSEFALGALALGVSAPKAVAQGIKFDRNSGGPVQAFELKERKKRARTGK
jgi:hypothetical protein